MEKELLNKILDEIRQIKENQIQMNMQISELAIGQVKLSQKIDATEASIRADMKKMEDGIRADMKKMEASIRADMKEMEHSLRIEIQETKQQIQDVKEIADFGKETCETIINVFTREQNYTKTELNKINNEIKKNKNEIAAHSNRISYVEKRLA